MSDLSEKFSGEHAGVFTQFGVAIGAAPAAFYLILPKSVHPSSKYLFKSSRPTNDVKLLI